jgi:predicted transcriptional regulator of viral defense system
LRKLSFFDTLCKILLVSVNFSLEDWVDNLLSRGRHSFSLNEARSTFSTDSEAALKLKLTRLSKKGKIVSVHQGYYIIITPQYIARGILPVALFVDGLMKFLSRPYYVGLLNAAAFYGAAHQQPQEYFVFTNFPVLRPANKKGIRINYISKKQFNSEHLEQRKTETGFITISNPLLTAVDLVQFEKRIGGLNRAATVLNELAESLKPEQITLSLLKEVSVTAVQRLGFLLEIILKKEISEHLFAMSKQAGLDFFRVPLKLSQSTKGFSADNRWKIIVNTEIEIDE